MTRMITGLGEMAYEDRLKQLKLPTLPYHNLGGDMIEPYNIITEVYDRDATTGLFNLRKHSNTRGQQYKILDLILLVLRSGPDLRAGNTHFSSE